MQPLHLITAEQEEMGNMLRMSLINVAVKSGPPSPCPFCCSVLVPLRCSQSLEQIVTLMMDMQPPPSILLTQPHGWSRVTALPACVLPPPPASPGSAWGVVRQPCSLHQLGESRRQPCILTSLALTSLGGMRLSL